MNWYKKAQNDLSQYELKNRIESLKKQYSAFLDKQYKTPLTPEEEISMKKVGDELNNLGRILWGKIEKAKESTKQSISQNKEYEVSPDNFANYHYTGSIPENAYRNYEKKENISFLGAYEKHPKLVKKEKYENEIIEFRSKNEPLRYVKTDENDETIRDEQGLATYLSLEEMQQKKLPLTDTTIVAFNQNKEPIGWASNEFGADGVWVVKDYQSKGIGTDLLYEFRKQFPSKRKIGQMTNAGINMTRKYHKKLIQDALKEGKNVPKDILKEYNLL
jgi:GNAT superfamily N-acetyltransferase